MKIAHRFLLITGLCAIALPAQSSSPSIAAPATDSVKHLQEYQVVELRRYTTTPGKRGDFVRYFDTYFPEAFEQLGAMIFGQFIERDDRNRVVWLRGFKDIQARPVVNAAFYYGPLWREHRAKVNAVLPDSDNVMLMRPLHAGTGITVLPAVDPVLEPGGARGIFVAQIFPVEKEQMEAFSSHAEKAFLAYDSQGVRTAGVLVTLDVPNNFPQLPIRQDGPWLVWLGLAQDDAALRALSQRMDEVEQVMTEFGGLRDSIERIVMDPTPRSRLRWPVLDAATDQDMP
ncbi:NIPSNAP family protein [Stenotrophomonas sp. 278]|uniref:NIPSNAP family protein n=1 Tax=Stenotrophomonas sp. 278 TaxID=2479851 RepID=UPI000F682D07|nr:NIPSNAP family protein [Stenotrophomonas sp. 278]RRU07625.1 hypothetical protein EGJ34_16200 [Stenotrophomonas sp. 278]